jgi:MinD superfamily P-loop ATPase
MTRELVVISGKGGTGKTSIAASLAALARPVVLADCDVDAADLHLLSQPQVLERHDFSGGKKASIKAEFCLGCGQCATACRFDAIHPADGGGIYEVDPIACEGCGACTAICTADAIRFEPAINGEWMTSQTRFGPMVHARLNPGEENCGKLVSVVRREAQREAEVAGISLIMVDGSPGIGCPVIASLTGADLALVIAEPTLSGLHDALRVIELAGQLRVPVVVCVNRWDLNPAMASRVETEAASLGASLLGRVREDLAVVQAQMRAVTLIEHTDSGAAIDVRRLWDELQTYLTLEDADQLGFKDGTNYEDCRTR